jgi:putative transposase
MGLWSAGRTWPVRVSCDTVANADVNGAENTRQKVLPSLAADGSDRDNGWLAQPAVHLFDRSEGGFAPREEVVNRES